jgi:putative membrane protein
MKRSIVTAAVVLAMGAAPAFAQSTRAKTQRQKTGRAASDQTFVMDAAKGGMAEVELGKLAAEKASNNEVKQFGQRMVDDHGKANNELKSLASSKNITLPNELDAKDKAVRDRLSKLSGAAFDRAYMQAMLRDHRKDVNEFKRESTSGKDPEIKAFASKTLPTLEEHLKQAETATRAVGTTGTVEKSGKAKTATPGQANSSRKRY